MGTVLLSVAYDGAAYSGAATQKNAVAVSDTLHRALVKVGGEVSSLRIVSRTDAGVHARDQRVAFDTPIDIPMRAWVLGVIRYLPDDIVVQSAARVPDGFTPRFVAIKKHYRYQLYGGRLSDPFLRKRAWRVAGIHRRLAAMQQALEPLCGRHDFSAFSAAADARDDKHCNITHATAVDLGGDCVAIDIHGNRFVYNMVRIIVGTAVDVARGRIPENAMVRALGSGQRIHGGMTAPPHGLYLQRVWLRGEEQERWPPLQDEQNEMSSS